MANKIVLKKSSVAAKIPVAGDLDFGELAINYTDGKLYFKKADNSIDAFTTASAAVTSVGGNIGDITDAQLLASIKNVDGTGSGLDADTLDGNHASAFYLASNPNGYTSNTGTVTSVSATAPLVSSGGTAPSISIPAANSTTNGYMTSTYAAKLDGIAAGANNYTLPAATSTALGGIELFSDTVQTVAANAVTATASRTYGVQVNSNGQAVVNVPWTDTNSGGTVTSVSGTGTVSGLTLTGTVTTSGNLTLGGTLSVTPSNFASQTANTVLAAPNGTAGTPTFRALVAADIPTLNQNTTGTASNVTGIVAIANGGTGASTQQAAINALTGTQTAGRYLRSDGTNATLSTIQAADVPTLNQNTTGSAATLTTGRTIGMTGDVTWTSGSFNGSANVTGTSTLASVGTAGTYTKVTTDAKGRVTSGTTLSASDIPDITLEKVPDAWVKRSVKAATTANITLSGTQTIDGIALVAGDRVLVKDQTTGSQNGIYVVSATTWSRSADADTILELAGACVNVDSGTTNGGMRFDTDLKTTDTLGTTTVSFYRVLDSLDLATANTANKVVLRDGSGNFSAGTITAALSGNATTATTLQTARTINGTSFNGSANITTSSWGTARTLTIGSTGKSVDGSANVSWTLAEIGAYAATNPNGYTSNVGTVTSITAGTGLSGGTITGSGTIALANTTVTAGSYTNANITVDAQGRITSASSGSGGQYFGTAATKAISYNANSISENITVTTGNNGLSAGPITINNGFTVTLQSGAVWVIV